MEKTKKFLSDYELRTESESEFQLIPSSAKQYFITLSLLGLILILMILLVIFADMVIYMLIYAIFMSIFVIFVTPIIWNKVFQRMILLWTNLDNNIKMSVVRTLSRARVDICKD